mmetsp:Transcript_59644/g.158709  ORF Transcript_59644/g.158709 Transcript_59644/m.158709 type:complete len:310 (-) Transcript_59644:829-1758(-)
MESESAYSYWRSRELDTSSSPNSSSSSSSAELSSRKFCKLSRDGSSPSSIEKTVHLVFSAGSCKTLTFAVRFSVPTTGGSDRESVAGGDWSPAQTPGNGCSWEPSSTEKLEVLFNKRKTGTRRSLEGLSLICGTADPFLTSVSLRASTTFSTWDFAASWAVPLASPRGVTMSRGDPIRHFPGAITTQLPRAVGSSTGDSAGSRGVRVEELSNFKSSDPKRLRREGDECWSCDRFRRVPSSTPPSWRLSVSLSCALSDDKGTLGTEAAFRSTAPCLGLGSSWQLTGTSFSGCSSGTAASLASGVFTRTPG